MHKNKYTADKSPHTQLHPPQYAAHDMRSRVCAHQQCAYQRTTHLAHEPFHRRSGSRWFVLLANGYEFLGGERFVFLRDGNAEMGRLRAGGPHAHACNSFCENLNLLPQQHQGPGRRDVIHVLLPVSRLSRRVKMARHSKLLLWLVSGRGVAFASLVLTRVEQGRVLGVERNGISTFFGLPYAAPPIGKGRWQPPRPPVPWRGIRDAALNIRPKCLQQPDGGQFNFPGLVERAEEMLFNVTNTMSEDCLFVNVATPARVDLNGSGTTRPPLPVLVYIHGGSNLVGSGKDLFPQPFSAQGIVFVSFNYRLGVLGALALPELLRESGTTGNYALQDQRAALLWVQRNVATFGGDAGRVTIVGESFGAMSVVAHIALPRSAGLFSQAVVMSGNDDSLSLGAAQREGSRFAALAGCAAAERRLDCLRGKDALALINGQTRVYNESMRSLQLPVADGLELPVGTSLRALFEAGNVSRARVLAGSNTDDISLFFGLTGRELSRLVLGQPMVSPPEVGEALLRFFPEASKAEIAAVAARYAPARYNGSARAALFDLGTDGYFACPTRRLIDGVAKASGGSAAFRYVFSSRLSHPAARMLFLSPLPRWLSWVLQPLVDKYVLPWLGSFHGLNEIYLFATPRTHNLTRKEWALSRRLVEHWSSFVATGAPLPAWKPWGDAAPTVGPPANGANISAADSPVGPAPERYYQLDRDGDHAGERFDTGACAVLTNLRFVWNPLTISGGPS